MSKESNLSEITVIMEDTANKKIKEEDKKNCQPNTDNLYRSACCSSKNYIDRRMLGFIAQCGVSFAVLGFSMRQISTAEKGTDLTIYYTLIGSIVGNFVPSYFNTHKSST